MKNISLLLLSLLLLDASLFSQRVIEVSYRQDMQGNYNFFCVNRAFCNYILDIDFTSLENGKCDHPLPFQAVVKPGSTPLFKLSKINAKEDIVFKYKTSNAKGCLDPAVNTAFTYLLPITPGKEAQAYVLRNVTRTSTNDAGSDSTYTIRLKMKPGDTIYAARRGTVTEVDVSSTLNDEGSASSASDNYIEIVHADCSFGRYGVLKNNGAFVKPGQLVEAGQPIGLVGGDKYGRGSEVRFSVSYNQATGTAQPNEVPHAVYTPLQFWTKFNGKGMLKHGATYTSEFPKPILTQELSRPSKPAPKKGKAHPTHVAQE